MTQTIPSKLLATETLSSGTGSSITSSVPFNLQSAGTNDRITYHRAIEAAVWAMPLMSFRFYRGDALASVGVEPNDIGYFSQLQDWRLQTATPNNTTPYIMNYWSIEDGPIVVKIPASVEGISIFGTIMAGGATEENLAKATAFASQVRIYPLAGVGKPPSSKYVDLYGKLLEMTPRMDKDIYRHVHAMIGEEVVLDRDLAMMGLLARIGIRRGETFTPDARQQAIFGRSANDAHEYMIQQYHRELKPFAFEGRKWASLAPSGFRETECSCEFPSYYDYHARGALFYAIITSVKNYGRATYYLLIAETPDGQWLDGERNYKLVMPAGVPVQDFWAITTYDLKTASFLRGIEISSIDSTMDKLEKNDDGSVTIYFGPRPEKRRQSNWLQTDPARRFFVMGRFYAPEAELLEG